jgi:hypothetical protein
MIIFSMFDDSVNIASELSLLSADCNLGIAVDFHSVSLTAEDATNLLNQTLMTTINILSV